MMTVRFNTVDVHGLKVFYRSAGDQSAPVVLLLHGFPSASHMFRDLIPELAGKYHVVAPDLPGFGMTEQPARNASPTPSRTSPRWSAASLMCSA